ncbi:MAG: non-canonical purine NTP pyrophosphatase [Vicinamibacterales bacterium]
MNDSAHRSNPASRPEADGALAGTVLLATTNPGKVREIRLILHDVPVRLLTLADLPPIEEPEETGATFEENALLKARYYAAWSGLTTVAEDSGLAIDALGGRPGIHSARYPGETYAEKFANLYAELAPHPRPWTARFVCALALVEPADGVRPPAPGVRGADGDVLFTARATVEGEITTAPRGTNGFGYDPIFHYPPYGGTLAEQDHARKLAVAHRGKAFRMLREWWAQSGFQGPKAPGA